MKRFVLSFFTTLVFSAAFSQKLHFVYVQAEPEQPFFAKVNDKVYHSTNSGYLILSRLQDSIYAISIGFPGSKWPEQRFTVAVNSKDHGYTLKNFGEKGWGLYDIEAATTQMATIPGGTALKTEPREVSAFTEILSKAANDPSLKEKPVAVVEDKNVAKEEKSALPKEDKSVATKDEKTVAIKEDKPVVIVPVVTKEEVKTPKDSVITRQEEAKSTQNAEPVVDVSKNEPPVTDATDKAESAEGYRRSVVTRKSESSMTDGLHLTFIDEYGNGKKDTIRIIIPNPKNSIGEVKQTTKEEKKFLDLPAADTSKKIEPDRITEDAKKAEANPNVAKKDTASKQTVKKRCASTAAETDFFKLRKNMAAATNDEAMIAAAKKYFKTKCFSSMQIKNLSTLFLNDAAKYKFFDAAYDYVSDQENFPDLVSELKDEYYINRFKAMLRPA